MWSCVYLYGKLESLFNCATAFGQRKGQSNAVQTMINETLIIRSALSLIIMRIIILLKPFLCFVLISFSFHCLNLERVISTRA